MSNQIVQAVGANIGAHAETLHTMGQEMTGNMEMLESQGAEICAQWQPTITSLNNDMERLSGRCNAVAAMMAIGLPETMPFDQSDIPNLQQAVNALKALISAHNKAISVMNELVMTGYMESIQDSAEMFLEMLAIAEKDLAQAQASES